MAWYLVKNKDNFSFLSLHALIYKAISTT